MKRISTLATVLLLSAGTFGARPESAAPAVTLHGWFSDKLCAPAKIKAEAITPNGTTCVKKCLDDGATPVFVDPKARAMYDVTNHPSVKDDVGYYLELTGVVDEKAKSISVQSVKRLGDVVQMCGRKK
jgi:hypothetical protein